MNKSERRKKINAPLRNVMVNKEREKAVFYKLYDAVGNRKSMLFMFENSKGKRTMQGEYWEKEVV